MGHRTKSKQDGITLVGLIFVISIVGACVLIALQVVPTVTEYMSVKSAIVTAKASGNSAIAIKQAFDRQADVGYIKSISSKDLEITQNGTDFDVSFAYQKKIPLIGPASLLLEYEGTTVKAQPAKRIRGE
jgi:Tfp pilus assembly protein PilE